MGGGFRGIRKFFDGLKADEITDLAEYLNAHPEEIDNNKRQIRVHAC